MKESDFEFIDEMVAKLEGTIENMVQEERRLATKIGHTRVEELKCYWHGELEPDEIEEFKGGLDYWDKLIIFTWSRLNRVHETRAMAGRAIMKNNQLKGK